MASQLDFAIAAGMFIVFIAVLVAYLTGYMKSLTGQASLSELGSKAYEFFVTIFGGKGVPSDWEGRSETPFSIGLMTDIYRIPIVVTEQGGTYRGEVTINASVEFDRLCENKTLNNTVRVLEDGVEIPGELFSQNFCPGGFLNSSELLFKSNFSAGQSKIFYVYSSADRAIASANYSLSPSIPLLFSIKVFPAERLIGLSASKMNALRNLTYDEAVRRLSSEYKVEVEVSDR
jgi:hypothetical protein